jgi:hypothetical protein
VITVKAVRQFSPAALVTLSVAFSILIGLAQQIAAQGSKINKRNPSATETATPAATPLNSDDAIYGYEFTQPQFLVKHIIIEHDSNGRGKFSFERQNQELVSEPLQISPTALSRILTLYSSLGFLESSKNYQSDKQFPHLGTVRLTMQRQTKKRTAEFNWTNDKAVSELGEEYRRLADQALFVFDIDVARENQPLNAPKLLDGLESLLRRNGLSDPEQLVPLLTEITTDEHLPLIARNHADRILKKINKPK